MLLPTGSAAGGHLPEKVRHKTVDQIEPGHQREPEDDSVDTHRTGANSPCEGLSGRCGEFSREASDAKQ